MIIIYVLIDPITCKIRYIGRTKGKLTTRLNGHISKAKNKNTHKDYWIYSLKNKKIKPIIKQFKVLNCSWEESYKIEQSYIERAIKYGFDLLNHNDRGSGSLRNITEDQKIKISNTLKEKYKSGEIQPTFTKCVDVYDLNLKLLYNFNSITDCAKQLKTSISHVEKCLYKKCKTCKNLIIVYSGEPPIYEKQKRGKFYKIHNIFDNSEITLNTVDTCKLLKINTDYLKQYLQANKVIKDKYRIARA